MPIYTSILSASQGAILSGSLVMSGSTKVTGSFSIFSQNPDPVSPVMDFTRNKTAIDDGDRLGSIQWAGEDASHPGVGAELRVTATRAWNSEKLTSAKVEFFAVDENNNYPAGPAKLVISASSPPNDSQKAQAGFVSAQGSVGINNDLVVYGSGSVIGALQVGEPTPNNFWPANQSAAGSIPYQKFRVSNRHGDAQMAIDTKDGGTGAYTFTQGSDGRPEQTWGWFYDTSANNKVKLSWRAADDVHESGKIVLPYPGSAFPVRIGGGGPQASGQDGAGTLIVSESNLSAPSWIKINAIGPNNGTFNSNHRPLLSFTHRESSETTNNDGNWTLGVTHKRTGVNDSLNSFCIASPSQNKSNPHQLLWMRALTVLKGGVATKIGIGAPNQITNAENWSTNWASTIPSASLHIENSSDTQNNDSTYDVTDSQLFIRNNDGDAGRVSGITFDVSTDKTNPAKFSGKLSFVKDTTAAASEHTAYASIGLNDGYENPGSATYATYNVRDRVRIDNQGGIIFISGSYGNTPGNGFPGNQQSDYSITAPYVPSGSLTLVSLYNGSPAYNASAGGWVGMKTQPTINLVSQPSATPGSRGSVVAGDHLGRIAWWSADANFSSFVEKTKQVGAYIEGVAADTHDDTNKSPTWIDAYTRGRGENYPHRRMRISSSSVRIANDLDVESGRILNLGVAHVLMNGDGFRVERPIILGSNIIQNADRENTIVTNADQGVEIVGALKLTANTIQASDGTTAVTLADATGDVTTGGKLKTDFVVSKSTNITLDAAGDIILSADGDQITMDDGTTTYFTFNLDATPELDVNGDFIIDATSVDIKDELKITGAIPTLTIGDGGDEDIRLLFNSNTNDYYIGSDATDDRLHFGYGSTIGSSAVAQINQNVSFVANTFETINWCTNIFSSDTSGTGTYRMFNPLGTTGLDWTTTTSITGISDRVWIAPCDGAVEACIFSAEYRLRSQGSSTSNRDNVRVHLYRQSATTDSDDGTQWSAVGSSIHMMSDNCTANGGNYYGVFYRAGTSQATKRTGAMSTFGFTDPANNDYDTTDGQNDMSTNWTFSRGDKLAFVILYDAYDDTNPFYNEIGDTYTTSANTIKCKMTVRLDWASDGSF